MFEFLGAGGRFAAVISKERRAGGGVPAQAWLLRRNMLDLALSIAVLAAIALLVGAIFVWRRGDRQKAVMMVILAAISLVNVGIWTLPDASGTAPLAKAGQGPD